jgi:hypothetical protein
VRKSEDAAKVARDWMRVYNRLLAYVEEHDHGDIGSWSVVYSPKMQDWGISHQSVDPINPTIVQMTLETAKKLAQELNEGTVVL